MSAHTGPGGSRVFDGLADQERQRWLDSATRLAVRRGQTVVRQGDPATRFFLVDTGAVKLVQLTPAGQSVIVRFIGPADPFGGVAALAGAKYPVTALGADATRLLAWESEVLARLLAVTPQVRANIMREISRHMTDALARVRELSTERVGQRLAHALLRLVRQSGRWVDDGVVLGHALTRQELADLTGTTIYTVSRTLTRWQADGILRTKGRRVIVTAPDRLEALTRAPAE